MTPESLLELEAHAVALFQEQSHLYLNVKSLLMDDSLPGWWALMQHYGTPTRLIDWTASPYVGAYFAVRERPHSCGAIWVVGPGAVDAAMLAQFGDYDHSLTSDFQRDFLMPAARGRVHFFWRTRQSERMAAQQGHFSMAEPIMADQAELIWSVLLEEDLPNAFGRIVIPAKQKPEFLYQLAQMNINGRTLFPGVDGLGRSIAEIITLGLHFGLEGDATDSQPSSNGNAEFPEKLPTRGKPRG